MKTLTWTVEFNWDYNLDYYVEKIIEYIKINNLNLEQDLKKIKNEIVALIHEDIACEDDDLYYNFGDNEYDKVINEIIEKVKENYIQQIPLDI